ncbi:MAG: hypothetical protein IM638_13270, partial [Bacteroidetes bacterium]|nr:hypothetical protein [Bacteroidota bacterium]
KRNPFREDQLSRRTVGDVEYIDIKLDNGQKITLKKDANGNWKVERSTGKPTMMDAEILGRVPGENDNNQTAKSINNKLDINLESSIENIDSSDVTRKLYRIDKPGEGNIRDINKYISLETIPEKYKQESNFEQLAEDPDQGGNISPKTRVEAMTGIEAINIGAITPPITRGPKGIEFYDGNGNPWDVKAPPSPYNNEFIFNPKKSGESILNELRNKGTPPGYFNNSKTNEPVKRSVILNSTFLNIADHKSLWEWLNVNLTQDELQRIVEVKTQL